MNLLIDFLEQTKPISRFAVVMDGLDVGRGDTTFEALVDAVGKETAGKLLDESSIYNWVWHKGYQCSLCLLIDSNYDVVGTFYRF